MQRREEKHHPSMVLAVEAGLVVLLLMRLAAATADNDREALLAFKAGVSDPAGALRSWNDTAHSCRWPGVSCTAGRVTSMDVSRHGLTGTLSSAVGDLTYLRVLNLSSNGISGSIPPSLGRLQRLSYLGLSDNAFTGEIPNALRNCTSLDTAYLNKNHLSGSIPPSLANLTKLVRLELEQNLLEGGIPDGFWRLPHLRYLSVYQNQLAGPIPPAMFNVSSLQGISLANNAFHGELPADAGTYLPNLQYLFLARNRLTGPIPASLANASAVRYLSLADNSFTGQVPREMGSLCMQSLRLCHNELTAVDAAGWEFLDGLTNCSALAEIFLDGNQFAGAMPGAIARLSPRLRTLNLAGNRISGVIPPGIGNIVGLQTLYLDSNLLAGTIPDSIGNLKSLQELRLHDNKLSGPLPSSIGNLKQLLILDLSSNLLNESIPPSLGNLQQLTLLNLSGNELIGPVPRELFSLSALSSAMDLSHNKLDGLLPQDVSQLVKLALMALSGNRFSGEMPTQLGSCQSLEFLDLDSNLFTGSIPSSLSRLKGLRRLNLTSNRLSGNIPPELGQMPGLQELYLSHNDLSGGIPAGLESVSSLIKLDLSYNNLDGPVPQHGVFANATGFRMAGNGALCGGGGATAVRQLHLPPCRPTRSTRRAHLSLSVALPIAGFALCFVLLLTLLRRRKSKSPTADATALNGDNFPRVSYAELAKATNDFADANLIGAGKCGAVYQGTLPLKHPKGGLALETVLVAIKVFHLRQMGASKSFLSECGALRSVRHRNLISIITCCSSVDTHGNEFRALVFDFMKNSSLDRWLHPSPIDINQGRVLSVTQRFNIAVDIADALNYLHNSCNPPIIHCDLKPSNVLLGEDMTACIGDFGLAKLLSGPGSHVVESTIGIRGTIGYVAPEYGTSGKVSTSGDVYSFGILLLEIFAGKTPTDHAFGDSLTLPEFVDSAFPEKIDQILDPALLSIQELCDGVMSASEESEASVTVHDCLVSAISVGLSCCRRAPHQRMGMRDAATELRLIRDACVRACGQ
ncbi:hypothetical protein ACP70R_047046 [Stipagrostis hirtigluma subsp. patula]